MKGNRMTEVKSSRTGMKSISRREAVIIVLFLLVIVGAVWYLNSRNKVDERLTSGIMPGSEDIDYSEEEEKSIRMQINSRPVFEDGESEGDLLMGNPEPNEFDMEVRITLSETGEEVYNSGIIPPGYYIEYDRLGVPLEQGEHEASALITYYTDSGAIQTQSGAKLTLVVEN